MGMFDEVSITCTCPYCSTTTTRDAQTKDLDNAMWHFVALRKDWFKASFEKKFRKGLPVFLQFPYDKPPCWQNQAERIEAQAKVPSTFTKLKFVEVIIGCEEPKCKVWAAKRDLRIQGCVSGFGRHWDGKIRIKNGMLTEPLYDVQAYEKKLPAVRKKKAALAIIKPGQNITKVKGNVRRTKQK